MINLLAIVSKGLLSGYIIDTIYSLLGLLVVPLLCFLMAEFVGRHVQGSFGYAFGAHTQALFGGAGALLHEFYTVIIAFICGHSLRMIHSQTLYNMRMGFKLDSAGYEWDNHSIWNKITSFFLGVLPYYMMVFTLLGIQRLLGGLPLTTNVIHTSLKTYMGLQAWKTMIFDSLGNDFSVSAFGFIFLIIIVILLCLNGFNISSSENSQAFEGIIPWSVILILTSFVLTTMSYGSDLRTISLDTLNISIWVTMKIIWYMLGVWIIVLCFSLINHTSDAVHKVGATVSNHRINSGKGGKIKQPKEHKSINILHKLFNNKKNTNQRPQRQQPQPQMKMPVQHRYVNTGRPTGKPMKQKPENPNMNPNYNPIPQKPMPNSQNNRQFQPQSRNIQSQPINHQHFNQQPQQHLNQPHQPMNNNYQPNQNNRPMMKPQMNSQQQPQLNQPKPNINNMQQRPMNNNQPMQNNNTNNMPNTQMPNTPQNKPTNNIPQSQDKGIKGKVKNFFIKLDNQM